MKKNIKKNCNDTNTYFHHHYHATNISYNCAVFYNFSFYSICCAVLLKPRMSKLKISIHIYKSISSFFHIMVTSQRPCPFVNNKHDHREPLHYFYSPLFLDVCFHRMFPLTSRSGVPVGHPTACTLQKQCLYS